MSLTGKVEAERKLRGKINKLDVIYTDTYEIAVKNGYKGTVEEWLASLHGKSAYQYAKEAGFTGTEEEFASWLAYIDLNPYAKKNEIPKNLSEMTEDEMHRTVTDAEKQEWSAKSNFTRVLLYEWPGINGGSFPAGKLTATDMVGEYSGVEVLFYCKRGGSLVSSGFIPKDTLYPNGAVAIGVTDAGELVTRTVKYSGNVFTFGSAKIGTGADERLMLPWRIYGYK